MIETAGDTDDEYDEEVREALPQSRASGLDTVSTGSDSDLVGDQHAAGRLLRPGDRVEDVSGVFSVERVENRRISRVRFRPSEN